MAGAGAKGSAMNQSSASLVVISEDLLLRGRSEKGAWTREQLALIGVGWPPAKGWKKVVIGREIAATDADAFISLSNTHMKGLT